MCSARSSKHLTCAASLGVHRPVVPSFASAFLVSRLSPVLAALLPAPFPMCCDIGERGGWDQSARRE